VAVWCGMAGGANLRHLGGAEIFIVRIPSLSSGVVAGLEHLSETSLEKVLEESVSAIRTYCMKPPLRDSCRYCT
jgi:hypothetical protein